MKQAPERDIRTLKGVGDAKAKLFAAAGIRTVGELIAYYPRDYEDRRAITPVGELRAGTAAQFCAELARRPVTVALPGHRSVTHAAAADETGGVELTFFNQPYLSRSLVQGRRYLFYGKIERGRSGLTAVSPEFEPVAGGAAPEGRILPVYRLTKGLGRRALMSAVRAALEETPRLEDPLPEGLRLRRGLCEKDFAVRTLHLPPDETALNAARERMIFEELFLLSLGLGLFRGRREGAAGTRVPPTDPAPFLGALGYALTGAQRRALDEIAADMASGRPMNRLVQGDVGSGKTAVAAAAAWTVMVNGGQAALMAPTEVLAVQHFEKLSPLMARFGLQTALLTGHTRAAERRKILAGLASGEIAFAVGTHALFTGDVAFARLRLVICDEQQRFGVDQRAGLVAKGDRPHVMVMSATPIPRTLALMIYGDLDISVIDEMPPGRKPVATYVVGEDMRPRIEAFVRKQAAAGRQVYVVCPAIDEDDAEELRSVTEYAEKLSRTAYADLRVGVLHGRMKPAEKEAVMAAFRRGETDVLVSTTVIEVGVDNPNATLMVVENAERFGLSQLHQLRGRVGRGGEASYCVLMTAREDAERLKILAATNDGFVVAQKDLELRGPGEFFGSRQSGLPTLRMASLTGDMRTLRAAQDEAAALLAEDPGLRLPAHAALKAAVGGLFSGEAGNRFN